MGNIVGRSKKHGQWVVNLSTWQGWALTLCILFGPALAVAYFRRSVIWVFIVPVGMVAAAFIIAALPLKRVVSADELADELEAHLLHTEGEWDWDYTTSVAIADPRLNLLRLELFTFDSDSLKTERDREKLRAMIDRLRRGELPEVGSTGALTYKHR